MERLPTPEHSEEDKRIDYNQPLADIWFDIQPNEYIIYEKEKYQRIQLTPEERLSYLERDNFLCRWCGEGGRKSRIPLNVHHLIHVKDGGTNHSGNLVTLCTVCHRYLHKMFDKHWSKGMRQTHIKKIKVE